jgi:hypothetical protein
VRIKFLAACAAVIFFSAAPALAETASQTLEDLGFFGRWAMNCDEPPSESNTVRIARVSATGDAIFKESLGGPGEPNIYVVLRVTRTDTGMVLRTKLNGTVSQDLTIRRDGDRIRTITNRDVATGRFVVRKGVIVSNGRETPWLTRCTQEPPGPEQT